MGTEDWQTRSRLNLACAIANGTIELNDVVRASKVQTAIGKVIATLARASDGPMEFVTGRIDVTIKPGFNAGLDASTVHGGVSIDDQFGVPVQKELMGQHARGQLGCGWSNPETYRRQL